MGGIGEGGGEGGENGDNENDDARSDGKRTERGGGAGTDNYYDKNVPNCRRAVQSSVPRDADTPARRCSPGRRVEVPNFDGYRQCYRYRRHR